MRSLAPLALILSAAIAHAQPASDFNVDATASSLTYHLVHKMHKVDGTSHKVDGKARLLPDGKAQVMLRAPVASFDSGNVNRDAHMKETVEAAKFPTVELKAVAEGVTPPSTFPATVKKPFKAQLSFHGVQQMLEIPVDLVWESPTRVRAEATFAVSLDGFKVERPSLMFVKVEDALKLDAKVAFTR